MRFFRPSEGHSLHFLNIAQFLGALNDNVFKLVVIFLVIGILGPEHTEKIIAIAGFIFVIPFILFSSFAGVLADRYSKKNILVWIKLVEVLIICFAILMFSLQSVTGSYIVLLLLSTQSAFFGPSKYGIIPELVDEKKVGKANGLITGFTYLSIIIGTFLASFLADFTDHNYPLIATYCLIFSLLGLLVSFKVKRTPIQGQQRAPHAFFIKEILATLKYAKTVPHVLPSLLCGAFFLFIGSFTQLNIIPFAMKVLKLSKEDGGYLFLSVALGIGAGSLIAGRMNKNRIKLGLSCLSGYALGLIFLLIPLFCFNLVAEVMTLVALGIFGGFFIVPFNAFIQVSGIPEKRGALIATENFLGFCGVLFSAIAVYFFGVVIEVSPSTGFEIIGIITLVGALILSGLLSDHFLPFIVQRFIMRGQKVTTHNAHLIERDRPVIFFLFAEKKIECFKLLAAMEDIHLIFPRPISLWKRFLIKFFASLHSIPLETNIQAFVEDTKEFAFKGVTPCICLHKGDHIAKGETAKRFIGKEEPKVIYIQAHVSDQLIFEFSEEIPT